jgi:hypothetical protein
MSLAFPQSPTQGTQVTIQGVNWIYNGTAWGRDEGGNRPLKTINGVSMLGTGDVNIPGTPIGIFSTLGALQTTFPAAASSGRTALVGASAPYVEYTSTGLAWLLSALITDAQRVAGVTGVAGLNAANQLVGTDGVNLFSQGKGTVRVLDARGQASSVTGTTTKTMLYDLFIPAGTIGPNSILQITPSFTYSANVNTKMVEMAIGVSTASLTFQWTRTRSTATQFGEAPLIELRSKGSTSLQEETYSAASLYGIGLGGNPQARAIDFGLDQHLYAFGTAGNAADSITLSSILVMVMN